MRLGKIRIGLGAVLLVLQVMSWIGNARSGIFDRIPFSFNPYVLGFYFGANIALIFGGILLFFGIRAYMSGKVYIKCIDDFSKKKTRVFRYILGIAYGMSFLNSLYLTIMYKSFLTTALEMLFVAICYALILVYVIFYSGRTVSALLPSTLIVLKSKAVFQQYQYISGALKYDEPLSPYLIDYMLTCLCSVIVLVASILLFYGVKRKKVAFCFWIEFGYAAIATCYEWVQLIISQIQYYSFDASFMPFLLQMLFYDLFELAVLLALPLYMTFVPEKELKKQKL